MSEATPNCTDCDGGVRRPAAAPAAGAAERAPLDHRQHHPAPRAGRKGGIGRGRGRRGGWDLARGRRPRREPPGVRSERRRARQWQRRRETEEGGEDGEMGGGGACCSSRLGEEGGWSRMIKLSAAAWLDC